MEIWKECVGFPKYEVSNLGRVRKQTDWTCLKPRQTNRGYLRVALYTDNGKHYGKDVLIHKLVMEAFVGPNPYSDIDHINHIRTDNRLENLRYVTHINNQRNTTIIKHVGKYLTDGTEIKKFETLIDAAKDACLPPTTLSWKIKNNKIVNNIYIYKFL